MQFMRSSLDKLVKNLSDNDFNYLNLVLSSFRALKAKRGLSL